MVKCVVWCRQKWGKSTSTNNRKCHLSVEADPRATNIHYITFIQWTCLEESISRTRFDAKMWEEIWWSTRPGFFLLLLVEVSCAHSTWFPTEDASSLVINRLFIAIFVTSNRTKLKESNKQSPGELTNCTHKPTAQWMRWKTSRNGIYGSTFSYNDNVDDHQRCLWSASAGRLAFFFVCLDRMLFCFILS